MLPRSPAYSTTDSHFTESSFGSESPERDVALGVTATQIQDEFIGQSSIVDCFSTSNPLWAGEMMLFASVLPPFRDHVGNVVSIGSPEQMSTAGEQYAPDFVVSDAVISDTGRVVADMPDHVGAREDVAGRLDPRASVHETFLVSPMQESVSAGSLISGVGPARAILGKSLDQWAGAIDASSDICVSSLSDELVATSPGARRLLRFRHEVAGADGAYRRDTLVRHRLRPFDAMGGVRSGGGVVEADTGDAVHEGVKVVCPPILSFVWRASKSDNVSAGAVKHLDIVPTDSCGRGGFRNSVDRDEMVRLDASRVATGMDDATHRLLAVGDVVHPAVRMYECRGIGVEYETGLEVQRTVAEVADLSSVGPERYIMVVHRQVSTGGVTPPAATNGAEAFVRPNFTTSLRVMA